MLKAGEAAGCRMADARAIEQQNGTARPRSFAPGPREAIGFSGGAGPVGHVAAS
ncbi:hypothetical protein ACFQU7_22470 [Pseudoroseomonas wenyumeiae]